jgi:acetyltransferase-like isoleucine patch superfamily enzyme
VSAKVFVHQAGLCESDFVGEGTRIWAFAHVLSGARVGRDCNICDGAYIEGRVVIGDRVTIKNQVLIYDGTEVEDDCFLGPGVVFTNDLNPRSKMRPGDDHLLPTRIGRGATIGANATVVCGIEIGERAFVGAGAVVVADLPANAFVVGNPAHQIGWACVCGVRLEEGLVCRACGRTFKLTAENRLKAHTPVHLGRH